MKREIFCMKCDKENSPRTAEVAKRYNEGFKRKVGKALRDFKCDWCAVGIRQDDPCVARSIYTNRTPYFEWEEDYLYNIKEA